MAQEEAHRALYITEILEAIILETDMATVLTSAQRVCRRWHALIQDSERIQIFLFFKPSKRKVKWGRPGRIQNPLIKANLWDGFFRKELHTRPRWQLFTEQNYFPMIDIQREHAYLRKEASWRRMLICQPPTPLVAIIETVDTRASPEFTLIRLLPNDNDFLRLGKLATVIDQARVAPSQDPLVFLYRYGHVKRTEREFQEERKFAVSNLLLDCSAIFFCGYSNILDRNRPRCSNGFDSWVDSIGRFRYIHGRHRKPIWDE